MLSPSQRELGAATESLQMQVATLFRESTTLLGATMEAGGGGSSTPDSAASGLGPGPISYGTYANPVSLVNKYKL